MRPIDRFHLFWMVCIPVRVLIGAIAVVLTLIINDVAFYFVGACSALVAIGFAANILLTLVGYKTKGVLGGRVWWKRARFVHCVLWGVCAALCFLRVPACGTILLFDALLGALFGVLRFALGWQL